MRTLHFDNATWHAVLAETGGNLIRLRHGPTALDILRTPRTHRDFEAAPAVHGIPLLFLPNRIADGRFRWNGRNYRLPVNEPARRNHLHGFLHTLPWELRRLPDGLAAIRRFAADAVWPHSFEAQVEYVFHGDEMRQRVTFTNTGDTPMPFLFGQHTVFRLPEPDSRITVTLADRAFAMDERWLPTGGTRPLPTHSFDNRSGIVSLHAPLRPDDSGFRGAVIEHPLHGAAVVYEVDPNYRFWVLWNWQGRHRIFCAEPHTCAVNAPNAKALLGDTGLQALAPGKSIALATSFRVQPLIP